MKTARHFVAFATVLLIAAVPTQAGTISWNTWTSDSDGSITAGSTPISVSFSTTNYHADIPNYPSWTPASTYADGVIVSNAPGSSNGIMQLVGGTTA